MGKRVLDFADGFSSASAPSTLGVATVNNAIESISASGTITLLSAGNQMLRVVGDGGAVTASTTPFGTTPPSDGTIIYLMGTSDTNTVTVTFNDSADGLYINGDAVLGKYHVLTLIYEENADRYIEISRNF